jgi:membrane dipeptidase
MLDVDLQALHARVPVADGHADSLMWNRDLNSKSTTGHVDFPRLQEAGVKIQAFTVVTQGFPPFDTFRLLAWKQKWPHEAVANEWTRCQFQIESLHRHCANSSGVAEVTVSGAQLEKLVSEAKIAAILGVEGGQALCGQVERVAELYRQGVRFMSLTHLANNALGGTSTPFFGNRPLTPLGHQVLDSMAQVGMAVDIAHASPATLAQIFEHKTVRILCSHGGVQGATNMWRNVPDWGLRKLADRGGVMGVIFARQYVGGKRWSDVVRHIRHALQVMGEDSVALGSDFDGLIPLPVGMRDVRDLFQLTQALLDSGVPVRVVEKVLGHNFRRFWSQLL